MKTPGGNLSRRILEEHKVLLTLIAHLQDLFQTSRKGGRRPLADIRRQLKSLRRRMDAHFDLEERSGKFDEIAEDFPRVRRAVAALYRQHGQLLEQAAGLVDDSYRSSVSTPKGFTSLYRQFLHLAAALRRHERKENDLILDAYYTDIGPGD